METQNLTPAEQAIINAIHRVENHLDCAKDMKEWCAWATFYLAGERDLQVFTQNAETALFRAILPATDMADGSPLIQAAWQVLKAEETRKAVRQVEESDIADARAEGIFYPDAEEFVQKMELREVGRDLNKVHEIMDALEGVEYDVFPLIPYKDEWKLKESALLHGKTIPSTMEALRDLDRQQYGGQMFWLDDALALHKPPSNPLERIENLSPGAQIVAHLMENQGQYRIWRFYAVVPTKST
jgi:hypothetical protein